MSIDLHFIDRAYSSKTPVRRMQLSYSTDPIIKRTVDHVLKALESCEIRREYVHCIVLVGSSSRLHAVTDALAEMFSRDSIIQEDVDTIVSIVAAVKNFAVHSCISA